MVDDLSAALMALESPPERFGVRAVYAIPAAILILLAAVASVWFYQRSEKRHWARVAGDPGNRQVNRTRINVSPRSA